MSRFHDPFDDELRFKLWPILSGGSELQARSDKTFLDYFELGQHNLETDEQLESVRLQIARDVDRATDLSLKLNVQKKDQSAFKLSMIHILIAFVERNRDLGYVQGQHNLVARILVSLNVDEEKTFWTFCAFCERILTKSYYAMQPKLLGFHKQVELFSLGLKQNMPKTTYSKLIEVCDWENIIILISLEWLLTLFSDEECLSLTQHQQFFDNLLLEYVGCKGRIKSRQVLQVVVNKVRRDNPPRIPTCFHLKFAIAVLIKSPLCGSFFSNNPAQHVYATSEMMKKASTASLFKDLKSYINGITASQFYKLLDFAYSMNFSRINRPDQRKPVNVGPAPMSTIEAKTLLTFTLKYAPKNTILIDFHFFKTCCLKLGWKKYMIIEMFSILDSDNSGLIELSSLLRHLERLCSKTVNQRPCDLELLGSYLYLQSTARISKHKLITTQEVPCRCILS